MITLTKYSIGYAAVPKVATTSIKEAIYQLENGELPPGETADARQRPAHDKYMSVPFRKRRFFRKKTAFNFIVLRDPAARILSCYTDKVLQNDRLTRINTERHANVTRDKRDPRTATKIVTPNHLTLDPKPSLNDFVLHLGAYRNLYGLIRLHTQPIKFYSGPDLGFFTRVYKVSEIEALQADLRAFTKVADLTITNSNNTNKTFKRQVSDLSKEAYDYLMWWLEPEYDFLSDYFTPPPHTS